MSDERSKTPTAPLFETYGPDGNGGVSWHEYFKSLRNAKHKDIEDEVPSDEITVLETNLPVLEYTATQKAIIEEARKVGFELRIYGARAHHTPIIQKTDGKRASAGDETAPAVDVFNVFVEGKYPKSVLAFKTSWTGRKHKFWGMVSDPIGRYVDVPGVLAQDRMREVQWVIPGSKEFQEWIDQWRKALTGISKADEKNSDLAEKELRKSIREMKKEMQ